MDAICVFLSSFKAAEGRTCHEWTGCEAWATGGLSLCLYCTMPMLCLLASSSANWSKHLALLIAFGWSVNLCVCVSCFAKHPLTVTSKHLWRQWVIQNPFSEFLSHPVAIPDIPSSPLLSLNSCHRIFHTYDSHFWHCALSIFYGVYCPH